MSDLNYVVMYSTTDKYYEERLKHILEHPRLNDFSDVIIAMYKSQVSISGCGCCGSPFFYFDSDDDNVSDITYDAKENEGFVDGVEFKVLIK